MNKEPPYPGDLARRLGLSWLLVGMLLVGVTPGCTAVPAQDTPAPAAEPLRVMAFNIRYGAAEDGDDHWRLRKDLVVRTIRDFAPHVLGVQEALRFQLDHLLQSLEHYRSVGQGRDGGDRGEFAAVLFDPRRLELVGHHDFWLSPEPERVASVGWDAALTRMCTVARLRDRRDGQELVVLNTHFDHRGERAREESGRLIAGRVQAIEDVPVLVLGDLNATEDQPPLQHLREASLVDTYRHLHPEDRDSGTFHGFRGGRTGRRIDYILTSPDLEVTSAAIDHTAEDGRYPSDHFPVTAVVRLAAPD